MSPFSWTLQRSAHFLLKQGSPTIVTGTREVCIRGHRKDHKSNSRSFDKPGEHPDKVDRNLSLGTIETEHALPSRQQLPATFSDVRIEVNSAVFIWCDSHRVSQIDLEYYIKPRGWIHAGRAPC